LSNESFSKPVKYILFAGALLVGLCLYTSHLSDDLYGDERGHTYKLVAAGNFWSNIKDPSMCHPPLYFMLAKISYISIGEPWAIRIPSVFFSFGTVLLIAFAAKRILGGRFFLLSVWLAALSPFILEFSAEGRAYAMLIFFSVATFWAFLEFVQKENVRNMLILTASSIGGGLTHYFFCFQLISIMVIYLTYKKKITRYAAGVFIITGVVLIPYMIFLFFVQKGKFAEYLQVEWLAGYFSITNFLGRLYMAISYGYSAFRLPNLDPSRNVPIIQMVKDNWALISLTVIAFSGFVYAWFQLAAKKVHILWFCLSGIAIPIILGLIGAESGLYLIREKHLAIIWVCYFFLLLLALDYLRSKKWGWIIIGCQITVILISVYHYIFLPNEYTRRMDWTGLIEMLEREVQRADCVVIYQYDIEHLSLKRISIWDRGVRKINLKNAHSPGTSISEYALSLHQSVNGTIYIVNNETDRHFVDPDSELILTLGELRSTSRKRFGRNLILYSFHKEKSPL
jgi:4-amino-4-deoxy-L-arabinose transferase-like glycosyltransferase